MFEQAGANSLADPILIGRKPSQQQTGNRVGRLTSSDRPRQGRRHDGRRREAIIANDPIGVMDDKNRRKALLLVGKRAGLEPPIERWLAAGELVETMRRRQWFGAGDRQALVPGL